MFAPGCWKGPGGVLTQDGTRLTCLRQPRPAPSTSAPSILGERAERVCRGQSPWPWSARATLALPHPVLELGAGTAALLEPGRVHLSADKALLEVCVASQATKEAPHVSRAEP